jgi:hypothetical protein
VVLVLMLPMLFALLAALAHRYPFGGARVMAYAAPAVILLSAAGLPPFLAWLGTWFRPGIVVVVLLLQLPAVVAGQRVVYPWPVADPRAAARYVEAHRLPSDPVIGNDWTHAYYFHQIGRQFIPAGQGLTPDANRVWIVVTTGNDVSRENRLQLAFGYVPAGWSAQPEAEFHLTTVVSASRP